jgi:hypothetical protein
METSEVGEPLFFPTSPSAQSIDETTTPKTQGPVNLLSQDSDYAKRYRKLLDQLVAIGIEQLIDVPKVVVVGSQSAGKSSILEVSRTSTEKRLSADSQRSPPCQALSGVSHALRPKVSSQLTIFLLLV